MTATARRRRSTAERLISAVGVVGNIENLGLEKLGVKTERGTIVIDGVRPHQCAGHLRDRRRRRPAHAGPQGRARGRHLRRGDQGPAPAPDGQAKIPGCTYCQPQVASVGLTEAEGEGAGHRDPRRPLPVRRQRQGHRARRAGGAGQDDLRREDRQAPRRAHGRRGGDRADPGLRHRHEPRDDRGGADRTRSSRIRRCPR